MSRPGLPTGLLLAASAAAAMALLASGGPDPPRLGLLALVSGVLGALPYWNPGGSRISLDRIPQAAMFFCAPHETAYLLCLCSALLSLALTSIAQSRAPGPRSLAAAAMSPAPALALASVSNPAGWSGYAAVHLALHIGDLLGQSLVSRMPRLVLRVHLWLAAWLFSLPAALIASRAAERGGIAEAAAVMIPALAYSVLSVLRQRSQTAYRRMVSEAAVHNRLAAELTAAGSVSSFLGLLDAYFAPEGGGVTVLTSQETGHGWMGWAEDRQHPVEGFDPEAGKLPDWGEVSGETTLDGRPGRLLSLSRARDMLLFIPSGGEVDPLAMDEITRRNLATLIAHAWMAVGRSLAIDEAFIAAAMILARLADSKDDYTHGHSVRVSRLCQGIGRELGLSAEELMTLRVGALLHDLGKVAIPVEILTKRGLLTREERSVIERHPAEGARILEGLTGYDEVCGIVQSHHERLDGKGYPSGAAGRSIPFLARIVAVADTFDAITSRRSYRADRDERTAMDAIRAGMGTQFDARIVSALERLLRRRSLAEAR